jgi:heme-degrading monooxygenase HmoA
VIARRWRVWASREQADAVGPYLHATGSGDALRTPGNEGALLLRRDDVEETLFELTTLWRSMDAIREFAGEDYTRAVLYENDEQYFLRWDERVEHFEVTSLEGLNQQVALGTNRSL